MSTPTEQVEAVDALARETAVLPVDELVETPERRTLRRLSKYERARLIGARANQIAVNAPVEIDLEPWETDPVTIANKELDLMLIPLIVRRFIPDGTVEDFRVEELLQAEYLTRDQLSLP